MSNILERLGKPLDIKEVDFRIQSINKGGYATILAYKDARVDMNRLDEVCGANWQKEYKYIESKGLLFCRVGIKIGDEWIWREDLGTESFSDKEKGQASDAFKRACFNWGIGRELYDYPLIQVKLNANEFSVDGNKAKATYNLKLKDWVWSAEFKDGKVIKLTAKDQTGALRYQSDSKTVTQDNFNTNGYPDKGENQDPSSLPSKEKNWLNKMDSEKNFTKEWLNVVDAVNKKKVTSVDQIREHYKVSKATEKELNDLLNLIPA